VFGDFCATRHDSRAPERALLSIYIIYFVVNAALRLLSVIFTIIFSLTILYYIRCNSISPADRYGLSVITPCAMLQRRCNNNNNNNNIILHIYIYIYIRRRRVDEIVFGSQFPHSVRVPF